MGFCPNALLDNTGHTFTWLHLNVPSFHSTGNYTGINIMCSNWISKQRFLIIALAMHIWKLNPKHCWNMRFSKRIIIQVSLCMTLVPFWSQGLKTLWHWMSSCSSLGNEYPLSISPNIKDPICVCTLVFLVVIRFTFSCLQNMMLV